MLTKALDFLNSYKFIKSFIDFSKILIYRIKRDRITMVAGSLAYITILSLVPLLTVLFFFISAFPMFNEIGAVIKEFLFNNLVPTANQSLQTHIEGFMANSNKMTLIGSVGLFVTSLLVIRAVDRAINYIWRTKRKRGVLYSFAVYWMILTLSPIMMGLGIAASSYLISLQFFNTGNLGIFVKTLLRATPFIFSFVSFWLIYGIVPTTKVPIRDAFVGAITASVLFELGKKVFAMFITKFPTYEIIYGVIAIIPILTIWIYISWCFVLLGAEVAASINSYRLYKNYNEAVANIYKNASEEELEDYHSS